MPPQPIASLAVLIARLARDAVNAQVILDQAHAVECARFTGLLSQTPGPLRELFSPLSPARCLVRRFELGARVCLQTHLAKGLEIRAAALNAGFDLRYGATAASESRVCLWVEQVPLPVERAVPKPPYPKKE